MTSPGLTIEIDPDASEIAGQLLRGSARRLDFRPAFSAGVGVVQRHIGRHLDTEGTSTGPRFAALSPRYAPLKLARWGPQPILRASGRLRGAAAGGPGWSDRVESHRGRYEITTPYAQYHQSGTPKMPRRPVVRYDRTVRGNLGTSGELSLGSSFAAMLQAVVTDAVNRDLGKQVRVPLAARLARIAKRPTR